MSPSGITWTKAVRFFHVVGLNKSSAFNLLRNILYFRATVLDDLDFAGGDKLPQVHKAVDGGIHREKIGINDGTGTFRIWALVRPP